MKKIATLTILGSFKCAKEMVLTAITICKKKSGSLIFVIAKTKVRDVLLSNLNNFSHFWGKFFSIVIGMGKFGLQAKGCQRDKKTSKTCHISQLFIHQHCSVLLSG